MKTAIYILLGVIIAITVVIIGTKLYFYYFAKKIVKINKKIQNTLNNGLLDAFVNNAPYSQVKDEYIQLVDMLDKYSEYTHFVSNFRERENERINDYMVLERKTVSNEKVIRVHIRAFPVKSLLEKFNVRECIETLIEISTYILKEKKEVKTIELISHCRILSEKIINNYIKPLAESKGLKCSYEPEYKISYLPWILSEYIFIHDTTDFRSEAGYSILRKINRVVRVTIT